MCRIRETLENTHTSLAVWCVHVCIVCSCILPVSENTHTLVPSLLSGLLSELLNELSDKLKIRHRMLELVLYIAS